MTNPHDILKNPVVTEQSMMEMLDLQLTTEEINILILLG